MSIVINWDIVIAVAVVFLLFVVANYLVPWIRKRKYGYYEEVKLALLLCGFAFRHEKIQKIADTAYTIVAALEELDITPTEKHFEAVSRISQTLLNEFNIHLDDMTLDLIIQIAVALLPPTENGN